MFTVCIPAHNEEENIQRIANNVRQSKIWMESEEKELIFCINGSSDRSVARAQTVAQRDPHVRVIVSDKKGKNNAWEMLVKESNPRSEFLYFVDADVAVNPNTFSKLESELRKAPSLAVEGARLVPIPENGFFSIHRRMYEKRFNQSPFEGRIPVLSGACYAIRRSEAVKVQMPKDQRIAEDSFLEALFLGRVKIIAGAKVSFRIPNFIDNIRAEKRKKVSAYLLLKQYPQFRENYKATLEQSAFRTPRNLTVMERYALEASSHADTIAGVLSWVDILGKRDLWKKLKSTKRKIRR